MTALAGRLAVVTGSSRGIGLAIRRYSPDFTLRRAMLGAEAVAEAVRFVATRPERVTIPEMTIEPRR